MLYKLVGVITSVILLLFQTLTERKCVDKKSATYCNRYKKRCFDPKRQAAMLSFCKKTCDLCDVDCNQQGYMINPEKQCVGKYIQFLPSPQEGEG